MPRRELPEVNAGSMADIAFTLLIFFLVSTTLATDKGEKVLLPKWNEEQKDQNENIIDVNKRNVFAVDVQSDGSLTVEEKPFEYSRLAEEAKIFMMNKGRNPEYSDSYEDAIINLRIHPDAPYENYIEAYSNIKAAFTSIRNDVAMSEHGMLFEKLDDVSAQEIKNKYGIKLAEKIDDFTEKK